MGYQKQLVADIRQAIEYTRRSFDRRIYESKQKLEDQLYDVNQLEEQYLRLAHTRLDIRDKRPNIELVYDAPQKRLVEEIREIECQIQKLQERLDESHVWIEIN